jgi:hypothetical protein
MIKRHGIDDPELLLRTVREERHHATVSGDKDRLGALGGEHGGNERQPLWTQDESAPADEDGAPSDGSERAGG